VTQVLPSVGAPPTADELVQPMMTIREAAALLHVHLSTIRRWEKSGWLISTRVGPRGHRRYSRQAVMKLAGRDGAPQAAEAGR